MLDSQSVHALHQEKGEPGKPGLKRKKGGEDITSLLRLLHQFLFESRIPAVISANYMRCSLFLRRGRRDMFAKKKTKE